MNLLVVDVVSLMRDEYEGSRIEEYLHKLCCEHLVWDFWDYFDVCAVESDFRT